MKYKKGIFCIEGIWNEGDLKNKLSVLPMLELLKRGEYCDYIYHDCATMEELKYFLTKWKQKKYIKKYPILYLAFHGQPKCINLARKKIASLNEISNVLSNSCKGAVIFFATCETLKVDQRIIKTFLKQTDANGVIGYKSEVHWIKATAFEMLTFDAIQLRSLSKRGLLAFKRKMLEDYRQLMKELEFTLVINE